MEGFASPKALMIAPAARFRAWAGRFWCGGGAHARQNSSDSGSMNDSMPDWISVVGHDIRPALLATLGAAQRGAARLTWPGRLVL